MSYCSHGDLVLPYVLVPRVPNHRQYHYILWYPMEYHIPEHDMPVYTGIYNIYIMVYVYTPGKWYPAHFYHRVGKLYK